MSKIRISKPDKNLEGTITLSGSKSISNRVLIIRALCDESFKISNLSDSDDTRTLQQLLISDDAVLDAHHAGTTYRFMTSYLALQNGSRQLTGSARMQERPIKALVDALSAIGANIEYADKDGYPPLDIHSPSANFEREVSLSASISSQYISSLLLVAPTLPSGLTIHLIGDIVSKPYLEMTLRIMEYFGVSHEWSGSSIHISAQKYLAKDFFVEADWSAASYYYIITALSDEADITLKGLRQDSLQGDKAMADIGVHFGIDTEYLDNAIRIKKGDRVVKPFLEYDFIMCPDIAQSVSTMAAGSGVSCLFSGLQTLKIKETDRIAALKKELAKVHVYLSKLPKRFSKNKHVEYYMQEGDIEGDEMAPTFATYKDHRMAMSFAPLAMLFDIEIEDHLVVTKSYPSYWEDLKSLGFKIKTVSES